MKITYITDDKLEQRKPYFPKQQDINDLIGELDLRKFNAEVLTPKLKQWNLLDSFVRVTEQRKRDQEFCEFFFCHI